MLYKNGTTIACSVHILCSLGTINTTLEPQPAASAKPQSPPVEPVSTVDTKPSTVDKDGMLLPIYEY